jgi:tetratricopeptide (TPR) repeat protein
MQEAIGAHLEATRAHQSLGAHAEAMAKLAHVLGLVERLPTGAPRLVAELTARQLRSFSAVTIGGYSAPETAQDHARCVELCEHLGLAPELLPSLILSWSYYTFHGDLAQAEMVCATIERAIGDSGVPSPATALTEGATLFFRGRFDEANALLEAFAADPWGQTPTTPPVGWPLPNDPLAAVLSQLAVTTWMRGERDAARDLGERALRRSAQLSFPFGPFSAGLVTSQLAVVVRLEGDHARAARLAAEMIELGERHGFVLWTLAGSLHAFISQVRLGDDSALAALEAAVGQWRELLSAELWTPYWLTELAGAQAAARRREDALVTLDEALAVAKATGSDFYTAETLRVRGVLRCELGEDGGRADLDDAVRMARGQGACALELRAVESLAQVDRGPLSAP